MQNHLTSSTGSTTRSKKPTDITPVQIDFAGWLAELPKPTGTTVETLVSVSWAADGGVTITQDVLNQSKAWAQLVGGNTGAQATVKAFATTSTGTTGTFTYVCTIE